jgi:hydrogenase expression/formation protein HypE
MINKERIVKLGHGSGGLLTKRLVDTYFLPHLENEILADLGDSALLKVLKTNLTFTTDSYVVSPLFFPGGDIGKLSIVGTVNDLTVAGSKPLFISAGFIMEEGMLLEDLDRIVRSMVEASKDAGVKVVAGDTKVVEGGKGDGVYINTSGVGVLIPGCHIDKKRVKPGDKIIVTGTVGDHGLAIFLSRRKDEISFDAHIESDCRPLNHMLIPVFERFCSNVHWCRDVTRGGLFTILNEALREGIEIEVVEKEIPVNPEVKAICETLGLDPYYLANEGMAVLIVENTIASEVLNMLRRDNVRSQATIIGEVKEGEKRLYVETEVGGLRIADPLLEDMVPRIC